MKLLLFIVLLFPVTIFAQENKNLIIQQAKRSCLTDQEISHDGITRNFEWKGMIYRIWYHCPSGEILINRWAIKSNANEFTETCQMEFISPASLEPMFVDFILTNWEGVE